MPCKDLSIALGLDRTALHQHVKRNRDFFGETAIDGDILSPDGDDYWVNELGLYLLLGRVSLGKVNPDAKVLISQFRQNVPVFLKQYRKKEIVPAVPPQAPSITSELQEARELAALCGKSPELFQAAVLKKHGKAELAEVLEVSPSVIHSNAGYYTPTRLIELFCHDPLLTPKRFNKYLENFRDNETREWKPFQYKDENKIWRLCGEGFRHGKEIMYEVPDSGGHKEIRVLWKESILYASGLKRQEPEDRTALTAGV